MNTLMTATDIAIQVREDREDLAAAQARLAKARAAFKGLGLVHALRLE